MTTGETVIATLIVIFGIALIHQLRRINTQIENRVPWRHEILQMFSHIQDIKDASRFIEKHTGETIPRAMQMRD